MNCKWFIFAHSFILFILFSFFILFIYFFIFIFVKYHLLVTFDVVICTGYTIFAKTLNLWVYIFKNNSKNKCPVKVRKGICCMFIGIKKGFHGSWCRTCTGQSHWSVKSRSMATGHSACLKSMSRTNTMQGLTFAAITATEKQTLMIDST